MQFKSKRILISIVAYSIIALSISVIIKLNVGNIVYTILPLSLLDIAHDIAGWDWWTIGKMSIIVDLIVVAVAYFVSNRKLSPFWPIIMAFIFGSYIDFWNWLIPIPNDLALSLALPIRIILFFLIINVLVVALTLVVAAHAITASTDYLTLALVKERGGTFGGWRMKQSITYLIIGFGFMFLTKKYDHFSFIGLFGTLLIAKLAGFYLPYGAKIYDILIHIGAKKHH